MYIHHRCNISGSIHSQREQNYFFLSVALTYLLCVTHNKALRTTVGIVMPSTNAVVGNSPCGNIDNIILSATWIQLQKVFHVKWRIATKNPTAITGSTAKVNHCLKHSVTGAPKCYPLLIFIRGISVFPLCFFTLFKFHKQWKLHLNN